MKLTEKELERYWAKIDKTPDQGPEGDCWIWVGSKFDNGYGAFWLRKQNMGAHRAAWSLKNGLIPEGACILHSCHNRCCVNPDHLRAGSQQDNADDMVNANRQTRGESHSQSKLTKVEVMEIRELYTVGMSVAELMEKFSIVQQTISKIVKGSRWSHIGGPRTKDRSKISMDDAAEIREQYSRGNVTYLTLAKKYGVNRSYICAIVLNQKRKAQS